MAFKRELSPLIGVAARDLHLAIRGRGRVAHPLYASPCKLMRQEGPLRRRCIDWRRVRGVLSLQRDDWHCGRHPRMYIVP